MTMMLSPGVSSAAPVLPRLADRVSFSAGFNGFASVRPSSTAAATSSSCSTSCGLSLRAPLIAEWREPSGRATLNLWPPHQPKQSVKRLTIRRATSRQQYNVPQEPEAVSLWLWICLASYRAVKDALQFLWEQPGQLKDIEWPSFQSTIRMAVLTVVVVALLIIFLATIDSTFSYVLASILRRVP